MRTRVLGLVGAAVAVCLGTTPVLAASSQEFQAPRHYYLALGDSLAFGFQLGKYLQEIQTNTYSAASFNTGYVDDFATRLQSVHPDIQTVNLGCPGETTLTFINGGCPYPSALHTVHPGTQQAAALAFLGAHAGQVSPITLDNGANDITPCQVNPDPTCVPTALQRIGADLNASLGAIREVAPRSEIIVMLYYNPYAAANPSSNALAQALNAVIATAALAHGARLADAFTPFNLALPQPQTLCTLTLFCTALHDVHASDAGYQVIADQFWAASSYTAMGD